MLLISLPPDSMNGGFSATKSARAPANLRRGFFRLWLVLSLCWIAGASWFLRDQLYFGYTWEMPWRLIAPQFVDLPSHEVRSYRLNSVKNTLLKKNKPQPGVFIARPAHLIIVRLTS